MENKKEEKYYKYFDKDNKCCLHNFSIAETEEEMLYAMEHAAIYVTNMDKYVFKTFRLGQMDTKIMKKLPLIFDEEIEVYENDKKKLKTKKDIFKKNLNRLKKVNDMVFVPHAPNKNPILEENNFNIYKNNFKYDEKKKINEELIKPILNHIKILVNHNKDNFNYVINWMAKIIQNPNRKTGVLLVFKSKQGTGKSSFWNWFGNSIIGKNWYLTINDAHLLIDNKFNSELQNKLFTLLDEAQTNGKYIVGNERMKTKITENNIRIEPKGLEPYIMEDRNNYVLLTNNDFPVKIDDSDRRYCCFNTSDELIKNTKYFNNYFEILKNKDISENFYYYLLNLDIKGFNPENMPETELKTEIRIDSAPTPIKYLIDLYKNGAKSYIENEDIDNIINSFNSSDNSPVDSKKLYRLYKEYALYNCPGEKVFVYTGFIRKLKELLNINSEKSKIFGEITSINKISLEKGLISYFNIKSINDIMPDELFYDSGNETN